MNEILQGLMPALSVFAVTVGTVFLGWLTTKLNDKFGKEIEEAKKVIESFDRDALHKAMETAATLAKGKGLIGEMAVEFILDYVFKSTPDAVKGLEAGGEVLADLAKAKLEEKVEQSLDSIAKSNGIPPDLLRNAIDAIRR